MAVSALAEITKKLRSLNLSKAPTSGGMRVESFAVPTPAKVSLPTRNVGTAVTTSSSSGNASPLTNPELTNKYRYQLWVLLNDLIKAIINGNTNIVRNDALSIKKVYDEMNSRYGSAFADTIIKQVTALMGNRLIPEIINLSVNGDIKELMGLRSQLVIGKVVKDLKKKGVEVPVKEIVKAVMQTHLNINEIEKELIKGMQKLSSLLAHPKASATSIAGMINSMRAVMAVAMAVSGDKLIQSLDHAFSGDQKTVYTFFKQNAFKPLSAKDLAQQMASMVRSRTKAIAKSMAEMVKKASKIRMGGNEGGSEGESESSEGSNNLRKLAIERMGRVMASKKARKKVVKV